MYMYIHNIYMFTYVCEWAWWVMKDKEYCQLLAEIDADITERELAYLSRSLSLLENDPDTAGSRISTLWVTPLKSFPFFCQVMFGRGKPVVRQASLAD